MAKIKRELETIDEAVLLQSIHEQDKIHTDVSRSGEQENTTEPVEEQPVKPVEKQPETPDKPKDAKEPAKRKRNQVDYSSQFLQKNELKERSCVCISRRIHATISEIVIL